METQHEEILEIKKNRNFNKNYKGKLCQQNTKDERENLAVEGIIEEMDTSVQENVKSKKLLIQNIQEI